MIYKYFWLDEKVVKGFLSQSWSIVMQNQQSNENNYVNSCVVLLHVLYFIAA